MKHLINQYFCNLVSLKNMNGSTKILLYKSDIYKHAFELDTSNILNSCFTIRTSVVPHLFDFQCVTHGRAIIK